MGRDARKVVMCNAGNYNGTHDIEGGKREREKGSNDAENQERDPAGAHEAHI